MKILKLLWKRLTDKTLHGWTNIKNNRGSWIALAYTGTGLAVGYGASQAFGGDEDAPQAPQFNLPPWAQGLPPEILELIRGQVGQQVQEPAEFGIASQQLQQLLGIQPEQFQFPTEEINRALQAQQALQFEEFQRQIRPLAAAQGQLESTGFTNQIGQFLQGQQAQSLGINADLLTQQALQNLQTQRAIPGFQAGVAGQLAGLGGQRAGIDQFNLQLPFQTTIPAFQSLFGQGLQQAGGEFQAASQQFGADFGQFQQQQQQQAALMQALGGFGASALTGGLGALAFPSLDLSVGQGALLGLGGFNPSSLFGAQQLFNPGGAVQQSTRFNPNLSQQQFGQGNSGFGFQQFPALTF